MNRSKIVDLTSGSIVQTLLQFSWPLMLANLLQIVYNMVDMVIVGQFIGSDGLSAVSCGTDVIHVATALSMGFTSAAQVLVSQQIGKGNTKELSRLVGTISSFFAMIAVAVTCLGIWNIDFLLGAINVPPEVYTQAREYAVICLAAMIFVFGYNTVAAILRGMGDAKRPLLFIGIASITNLVLDIWFVAVLGWGPKGAALATAIGQAVSFGAALIYLCRKHEDFSLVIEAAMLKPDRKIVAVLCQVGVPLALQGASVNISKMFVHSFINAYGVVISAVNGVGSKITQCSMVVSNAMSMAGTSIVGQNFGAGKIDRIKKVLYITTIISLAYN